MLRAEVLARASSALGHGTIYKLGAGGMNPGSAFPWNAKGECDCSGFTAWCLGISRHSDNPWYQDFNGGWVSTQAILRDSLTAYGFFDLVDPSHVQAGDLIVYGNHDGRHGHVGIISQVEAAAVKQVIHCSKGHYDHGGDAIAEDHGAVFWAMNPALVRCAFVT